MAVALRSRSVRVALVLFVLSLAALHALVYALPFEDAFITYRYAWNLVHGNGLVYNPGELVEGYSSFSWTLLLALVHAAGFPLEESSQLLSFACGVVVLVLTMTLHARVRDRVPQSFPYGVGAALLVIASGTWAFYAASGMETTLFCALLLAAVWLLLGERALTAGAVLGAAALTRPEGVGYAVLLLAALAARREDRRSAGRAALAFLGVWAPYFAWRYLRYGQLAPNTYYAKASASLPLLLEGVTYSESFLVGRGFVVVYVVAALRVLREPASRELRLACALLAGALGMSVLVGGDTFAFHRFFLPAIPVGALVLVVVLERLAQRRAQPWRQVAVAATIVLVAAAWVLCEQVPVSTLLAHRTRSEYGRALVAAQIDQEYRVVGRFLREHAKPGSWLAVNAAGIVPFESRLPTIDMLGLNDAHIAHRAIRLGRGVIGHEKHDADYVLSRKPDLILLGLPKLAPSMLAPQQAGTYYAQTFFALPGDRDLLHDPRLARDYEPFYLHVGSGVLIGFVRKAAGNVLH
jgi:arabinofuranosyltransferase